MNKAKTHLLLILVLALLAIQTLASRSHHLHSHRSHTQDDESPANAEEGTNAPPAETQVQKTDTTEEDSAPPAETAAENQENKPEEKADSATKTETTTESKTETKTEETKPETPKEESVSTTTAQTTTSEVAKPEEPAAEATETNTTEEATPPVAGETVSSETEETEDGASGPEAEGSTPSNETPVADSPVTTPAETPATTTTVTQTVEKTTAPTDAPSNLVPISDLPTMTTQELTLNLSGINFPNARAQGDILNISSLVIPGTTVSSTKCQPGYILNVAEQKCTLGEINMMTNLDAPNLVAGDLNIEQLKVKQSQYMQENPKLNPIVCSPAAPYLSSKGCINCEGENPLFNLKTSRCTRCPEGSEYNSEVRNCQTGAAAGKQYVSNLNNENYLVLPGSSLNTYREEIERTKASSPDSRTCPDDRPFSVGSECISCPTERPLFFIASRTCTACKQGSQFDSRLNSCVTGSKVVSSSKITRTVKTRKEETRKVGQKRVRTERQVRRRGPFQDDSNEDTD